MSLMRWPKKANWPPQESKDFLPFVSSWLERNGLTMTSIPKKLTRLSDMCSLRAKAGHVPLMWYEVGDEVVLTKKDGEERPGQVRFPFGRNIIVALKPSGLSFGVPDNGRYLINAGGSVIEMKKARKGQEVKIFNPLTASFIGEGSVVEIRKSLVVAFDDGDHLVLSEDEDSLKPLQLAERRRLRDGGSFIVSNVLEPYQKLIPYLLSPRSVLRKMMVLHPTGAGKTLVMAGIINVWAEENLRSALKIWQERNPRLPSSFTKLFTLMNRVREEDLAEGRHGPIKPIIVITPPNDELQKNTTDELLSTRGFLCRLSQSIVTRGEAKTIRTLAEGKKLDVACVRKVGPDADKEGKLVSTGASLISRLVKFSQYVTAGNYMPYYLDPLTDEIRRHVSARREDQEDFGAGDKMSATPDPVFLPRSIQADPEAFATFNPFDNAVVIMDEFHNAVNDKYIVQRQWKRSLPRLREALYQSKSSVVVGLTATIIVESPDDVRKGVNVLRGVEHEPIREGEFVDEGGHILDSAFRKLQGYVSVYSIEFDHHVFPRFIPEKSPKDLIQPSTVVPVTMSGHMLDYYARNNTTKIFQKPLKALSAQGGEVALKNYREGTRVIVRAKPRSQKWYEATVTGTQGTYLEADFKEDDDPVFLGPEDDFRLVGKGKGQRVVWHKDGGEKWNGKVKALYPDALEVKMSIHTWNLYKAQREGSTDLCSEDSDEPVCMMPPSQGEEDEETVHYTFIEMPELLRPLLFEEVPVSPLENPSILQRYCTMAPSDGRGMGGAPAFAGPDGIVKAEALCPKLLSVLQGVEARLTETGKQVIFCDDNANGVMAMANLMRSSGWVQWDMQSVEDVRNDHPRRFVVLNGQETKATESRGLRFFTKTKANLTGSKVKVAIFLTKLYYQGVNMKGVRTMHIVTPPDDMRIYAQLIGRVNRYCSHQGLPFPQDWTATLLMYVACLPKTLTNEDGEVEPVEAFNLQPRRREGDEAFDSEDEEGGSLVKTGASLLESGFATQDRLDHLHIGPTTFVSADQYAWLSALKAYEIHAATLKDLHMVSVDCKANSKRILPKRGRSGGASDCWRLDGGEDGGVEESKRSPDGECEVNLDVLTQDPAFVKIFADTYKAQRPHSLSTLHRVLQKTLNRSIYRHCHVSEEMVKGLISTLEAAEAYDEAEEAKRAEGRKARKEEAYHHKVKVNFKKVIRQLKDLRKRLAKEEKVAEKAEKARRVEEEKARAKEEKVRLREVAKAKKEAEKERQRLDKLAERERSKGAKRLQKEREKEAKQREAEERKKSRELEKAKEKEVKRLQKQREAEERKRSRELEKAKAKEAKAKIKAEEKARKAAEKALEKHRKKVEEARHRLERQRMAKEDKGYKPKKPVRPSSRTKKARVPCIFNEKTERCNRGKATDIHDPRCDYNEAKESCKTSKRYQKKRALVRKMSTKLISSLVKKALSKRK